MPNYEFFEHQIDCHDNFPKHKNNNEFPNGKELTTSKDICTLCKFVDHT
jgi:hypothetical protein